MYTYSSLVQYLRGGAETGRETFSPAVFTEGQSLRVEANLPIAVM